MCSHFASVFRALWSPVGSHPRGMIVFWGAGLNAPFHSTAHPLLVFLMLMLGGAVLDMVNKNTGDPNGDTSFVLSRRTTAYECRHGNANSFYCDSMTQFDGDDSNSTDLVQEWEIQIDGQCECGRAAREHPCSLSSFRHPTPFSCLPEIGRRGVGKLMSAISKTILVQVALCPNDARPTQWLPAFLDPLITLTRRRPTVPAD